MSRDLSLIDTRTFGSGESGDININLDTLLFDIRDTLNAVGILSSALESQVGDIGVTANSLNVFADAGTNVRLDATTGTQAGTITVDVVDVQLILNSAVEKACREDKAQVS